MGYEIKELKLQDLDTLINKYIIYYNDEGGRWTYNLAKIRLEQNFLTPSFYGVGLLTLRHQNNKTIEITYLKGILMVYFCTLILNLLIN